MDTKKIAISGKEATLYSAVSDNSPLVVFNNYSGDGDSVIRALHEMNCPDLNLLCIGGLNWDHDMTPWYCPPLSKDGTPCTGGADEYLNLLLSEILSKTKERLKGAPSHLCIAGYSLGGLFALYAMYRCDAFDRAASISGSLWFPRFKDYVLENSMKRMPDKLYLSLGDKEAKTKQQLLKTVQANTEAIVEHYRHLEINLTFELNPGNHFKDAAIRSAKGIIAII